MLPVFTKPLHELTVDDVQQLCDEGWPESDTVEFKETIPGRNGKPDPFIASGAKIAPYGREKIFAEIVAFANSYGGTLIIGIEETTDKPPKAAKISPVPRCTDLAERLKDIARSIIEPPLPLVGIQGIETNGDRNGVVVFRVMSSRHAPHRLRDGMECWARHGASSVRMTMREIQELTIHKHREGSDIEQRFARQKVEFETWLRENATRVPPVVMGIRATAIPLSPITNVPRLHGRDDLFLGLRDYVMDFGESRKTDIITPVRGAKTRPLVRGVRRYVVDDITYRRDLYENGTMDFQTMIVRERVGGHNRVYLSWIISIAANTVDLVDHFRSAIGIPDIEYALDLQVTGMSSEGHIPAVELVGFGFGSTPLGNFTPLPYISPRYSLGPKTEFMSLFNLIDRDLLDAVGMTGPDEEFVLVPKG